MKRKEEVSLKPEVTNRIEFLIVETCSCPILAERLAQYEKNEVQEAKSATCTTR